MTGMRIEREGPLVPSVVAVIPARYHSSRFPGKPLAKIAGKPMIQHVFERAKEARHVKRVLVATDDERIQEAVRAFDGEAVLTSKDCASGMDRVAEAVRDFSADLVVSVQGDEPLISPQSIDAALLPLIEDSELSLSTLASRIQSEHEFFDPNVVKVVFDHNHIALYFFRSPPPHHRKAGEPKGAGETPRGGGQKAGPAFKHIGLYVYRKEVLMALCRLPPTPREKTEGLEQLRALESGYKMRVVETDREAVGVDVPGDIARVEAVLRG